MILRHLDRSAPEGVSHDPDIRKRVLLRAGEVPGLTQLAEARLAPGQRTVSHRHADMVEVFLVTAGTGHLVLDGERHLLSPGACLVVEPGEVHELESTGPGDLVLCYFGLRVPG